MQGAYPCFKTIYAHEEFVEHFRLNPAERAVVETCREDANRHGVAVLLKAVQYLGSFPQALQQVPEVVRTFIAHQLQLLWDHTPEYPCHSRSHDTHLALIRQQTGWRFPTRQDKEARETWLRTQGAWEAPTEEALRECAYGRLRTLGIELPAAPACDRLVRAALRSFFQDLSARVTAQ